MAQFEIVELTPEGIVPLGMLGTFPSGNLAAMSVKSLSAQYPERKFQPRPKADEDDWRQRELKKFETGEYEAVSWDLEPIPDHFVHRAKKTKDNVAFTPSEEHGKQDRQSSIHVNNYLHRFYPMLTIEQRRKLVRDYTGFDPTEFLHFAEDEDEIATVYENGPGSCMAYPASSFAEEYHPTSSYFGYGLTLAYLKKGNNYTARAVVHLERKIWARMYGDGDELKIALEANGYREGKWEGDWQGVEFTAKHVNGTWTDDDEDEQDVEGWVSPYLDFANRARLSDDKKRFIIDRCGDYAMQDTSGIAYSLNGMSSNLCPICQSRKHGDQHYYQCDDGSRVRACGNCTVEKYGYCAATGYPLHADITTVVLHDGRKARQDRHYVTRCSITHEWFLHDECTYHQNAYRTPAEMREHYQKAA